MNKTLSLLMGAVWLLLPLNTIAQENTPKWKIELDNKAQWMRILPTGNVLVSTNLSLHCINPQTQQIIWENKDVGTVEEESFVEITGSPYAMYESTNGLKAFKTQTAIVDIISGRVVYSTQGSNISIREKTVLPELGAILLEIKQDKKVMLNLVEVESGKERWRMDLPDRKTGISLGALKQSISSAFTASPVVDSENNILFPDEKILKRLDARTGKVLWQNENEKSVGRLTFSDDGATVFVGSGKRIKAITVADGKEIWKDPLKISSEFKMFIPSSDNQMYVVTEFSITKIDYLTGKQTWKKAYDFARPFQSLRFTESGMLIFGSDEKTSAFEYVSFAGTEIWKRPYTTDRPVVSFELTPRGLLFANEEEANMIDLKTGDDTIWKKRIKLKGRPVTYIDNSLALIYAEKRLYRVNLENLQYELVNEDIQFKGADEDAQRIEVLKTGYLLSSQQNLVLVGTDGKIIYSRYYKPLSAGGTAGKILGAAAKVYATATNMETVQDPNRPNTMQIQRSEKGDRRVSEINDIIANRKKSFATQEYAFIMTRVEDGENKRAGMVKVDKATGEEKGKIVLKTQDPIYSVDEPTGQLFIVVNGVVKGCEVASFGL